MKIITLFTCSFILLASCMTNKAAMSTAQAPLYGTKWSLKKIHDESGSKDISTKAFIKFDSEKKSAGGNGSCNSFGSSTTVDGEKMTIQNIFSTKMYCEAVQETENDFLKQLGKVTRYEIADSTLKLFGGEVLLLEFAAVTEME